MDRFGISKRGSTIGREIVAGLTTFMTMAYVLMVYPFSIIGANASFTDSAGRLISSSSLLVVCALVSGIITLFMGLYANLPLALSTAMGTNFIIGAYVQNHLASFGWGMTLLVLSGILFLAVTLCGVRKVIVNMLPKNLKLAMTAAVGFFIAYLGFKNSGLISLNGGLGLGDFSQTSVLLALLGLAVMGVLTAYKVKGAILIAIVLVTLIGIPFGVTKLPASIFQLPSMKEVGNVCFAFDFKAVFANIPTALVMILVFFFGDFFATFSCLQAVGTQAGYIDENGNFPEIEKPFLVDSVGTVVGALFGCTTISTFIESTAGVQEGGRTGLTSITTAIMFIICIFFAPLFLMVPNATTGPALIFVGFSMLSCLAKLDYSDFKDCFGPYVMVFFSAFTGDIVAGICLGILADVLIKAVSGKAKEVHPVLYVLCIPLVLYFIVK
ncbi:MAG: NCS2 family permease [Spirochaetales bacterium]|nr:NCS2 family permease [Spirochaetales bacterium]